MELNNIRSLRKLRSVVDRFEGVVDEETLGLLTLYALGEVEARGVVRKVRLFFRKDCKALIEVELESQFELKNFGLADSKLTSIRCTIALDGNMMEKASLISPGSVVEFSGKFSGDLLKPERLEVLKAKTVKLRGTVAANSGELFCLFTDSYCFCCYCIKGSVSPGTEVEVEGALAEREVVIVRRVVELEENDEGILKYLNEKSNVFTPIGELPESGRVCVSGRISGIGELRKYRNSEYASLHIYDETGRVRLLLWNGLDVYRKADIGDRLEVFGGRVERSEKTGEKTLHCDEFTILRLC